MLKRNFLILGTVVLGLSLVFGVLSLVLKPAAEVQATLNVVPPGCVVINSDVDTLTETWDQPCYHIVTNTVTVKASAWLTVAPGTMVYADADSRLRVASGGGLSVIGTATQPVTFTSAEVDGAQSYCDWEGLVIEGATGYPVRVEHATIEYACAGMHLGGRQHLYIADNLFRYNAYRDGINAGGAIVGNTGFAAISHNTIYSCENGIVLDETGDSVVSTNTIHTIDATGIAFVRSDAASTDDTIADNLIYECGGSGVLLEHGGDHTIAGNVVYSTMLSSDVLSGAITLVDDDFSEVRDNFIYGNGGGPGYRAAIYVTGNPGSTRVGDIKGNVIVDALTETVELAAGTLYPTNPLMDNAFCAYNGHELRNQTGLTATARYNRWGTPTPNTPLIGTDWLTYNIAGGAVFNPWIALDLDVDASGLITVALRDGVGNTVPPAFAGPLVPPVTPPNARRIALASDWGTVSPTVVTVDDQGLAWAQLIHPVTGSPLTVTLTATDFCNEAITSSLALADPAITKTAALTQALPGDLVTYTIAYRNAEVGSAYDVVITDTLPANATYVTDTSGLACTGCTAGGSGPLTWSVGDLLPNAPEQAFDVTLRLSSAAACSTTLTNTAEITTTSLERDTTNNAALDNTIHVIGADVGIAKTVGVAEVAPGDMLTYTLVYSNAGSAPADDVVLVDMLPAYTTYLTDTAGLTCPACLPDATGLLTWTVGTSPAHSGPRAFALVLRVDANAPLGASLINTATITTSTPECETTNNQAQCGPVDVAGHVDLIVVKDDNVGPMSTTLTLPDLWSPAAVMADPYHRDFAFEGDLVTYTIVVGNQGHVPATDVVLTETLPANSEYEGIGWTHLGGGTYYESVGTLLPDTFETRDFVVTVADPLPPGVTDLDNVVCGQSDQVDQNPLDNCNREDTPVRRRPLLDKVFHAPFGIAGEVLTFTVTYSNPNTTDFYDLWITDTLPADVTWVADTALDVGWTQRVITGSTVAWSLPLLAAGAEGSFELHLTYSPLTETCGLTLENVVTMTVRNGEVGAYFAATDREPFDIECPGDLVVIKDDNVGPTTPQGRVAQAMITRIAGETLPTTLLHREFVYEGELITYTIAVENVGPYTVTNVVLTETLPLYTDYVGYGWSQSSTRTFTMPVGTLAPGEGAIAYFVARVHDPIPQGVGNLVNLVCGWGDVPDKHPADNCNYEDTPVRRRPLHVSKSAPFCIAPGEVFNYTPHYTNTDSLTDYTQVPLTDTLPVYVNYAGAIPGDWTCIGGLCHTTIASLPAGSNGSGPALPVQLSAMVPYTSHPVITNTIVISGGREFILTRTIDTGPDLVVTVNDNVGPTTAAQLARWEEVAAVLDLPAQIADQPEYVKPGDFITYTVTYANSGIGAAHNAVLIQRVPENTHYIGGGWDHVAGDMYTIDLGTVLPGQGNSYIFIVQVVDPFPLGVSYVFDEVEIRSETPECDMLNNTSNDDTPVRTDARLYVVNRDSNTIDVFETTAFDYVTTFNAGENPFGVLAYEDYLYVANFEGTTHDGLVTIIDLATHEIVRTVVVGSHPTFLAAWDGYVYVANHSGGEGITVIEHATGDVVERLLPGNFGFFGITADATRGRIYATKRYEGNEGLWRFTPLSGGGHATALEVPTSSERPYALVHNPQTDRIYVTFPLQDQLRVYAAEDFTLYGTYATQQQDPDDPGEGGHGLVTMGNCTYVANFDAESVTVLAEGGCQSGGASIAVKDNAVQTLLLDKHIYLPLVLNNHRAYPHTMHIPVGGRPKGMVGGGGVVFVTIPEQDRVAVIDTQTLDIIMSFAAQGDYPHTAEIVYDAPATE